MESHGRSYWSTAEVDFTKRPDLSVPQDGRLKADGRPVRMCDGCIESNEHIWMLMEEFPLKHDHPEFCYYCHDIPKPVKKPKKGEGFARYNEYVLKCLEFKAELATIRSEYREGLYRLKCEEQVIRDEYTKRKREVLARKQEHEDAYRETLRVKF